MIIYLLKVGIIIAAKLIKANHLKKSKLKAVYTSYLHPFTTS